MVRKIYNYFTLDLCNLQASLIVVFKAKAIDTGFEVNKTFLIIGLPLILHSTHQNIIFQHYYQPYSDYLLKMDRIDKEQAAFEQLTLSDFKKWNSIALKTFNNYTIIMNKTIVTK